MNKLGITIVSGAVAATILTQGMTAQAQSVKIQIKKAGTMYQKASTASKSLKKLKKNQSVQMLSKGKKWTRVKVSGKIGYVQTSILNLEAYENKIYKQAEKEAKSIKISADTLAYELEKGNMTNIEKSYAELNSNTKNYRSYIKKLDLSNEKKKSLVSKHVDSHASVIEQTKIIFNFIKAMNEGKTTIRTQESYVDAQNYINNLKVELLSVKTKFIAAGEVELTTAVETIFDNAFKEVEISWEDYLKSIEKSYSELWANTVEEKAKLYEQAIQKGDVRDVFKQRNLLFTPLKQYETTLNKDKRISVENKNKIKMNRYRDIVNLYNSLLKESSIYSTNGYASLFSEKIRNYYYKDSEQQIKNMEIAIQRGNEYRNSNKLAPLPAELKKNLNADIERYKNYLNKSLPFASGYVLNLTDYNLSGNYNNFTVKSTETGETGYFEFDYGMDNRYLKYTKLKVSFDVNSEGLKNLEKLNQIDRLIKINYGEIDVNLDKNSNRIAIIQAIRGKQTITFNIILPQQGYYNKKMKIEFPPIKGITYNLMYFQQ